MQQTNTAGELVSWVKGKNFGFFHVQGAEADIFVHGSEFESADLKVRVGDSYQFDVVPGQQGRQKAINLRPIL